MSSAWFNDDIIAVIIQRLITARDLVTSYTRWRHGHWLSVPDGYRHGPDAVSVIGHVTATSALRSQLLATAAAAAAPGDAVRFVES